MAGLVPNKNTVLPARLRCVSLVSDAYLVMFRGQFARNGPKGAASFRIRSAARRSATLLRRMAITSLPSARWYPVTGAGGFAPRDSGKGMVPTRSIYAASCPDRRPHRTRGIRRNPKLVRLRAQAQLDAVVVRRHCQIAVSRRGLLGCPSRKSRGKVEVFAKGCASRRVPPPVSAWPAARQAFSAGSPRSTDIRRLGIRLRSAFRVLPSRLGASDRYGHSDFVRRSAPGRPPGRPPNPAHRHPLWCRWLN